MMMVAMMRQNITYQRVYRYRSIEEEVETFSSTLRTGNYTVRIIH